MLFGMTQGHGNHGGKPTSVRLYEAATRAYQHGWIFLSFFVVIFVLMLVTLAMLDLLPEEKKTDVARAAELSPLVVEWEPGTAEAITASSGEGELPVRIEIPAIGLKTTIANPKATDIATLDKYLLSGAVRYPTSAQVGAEGNAIIFAHSSYLPIVSNKAFKAFNGIEKLEAGDRITVYGTEKVYVYEVETVSEEDAESGAIPLSVDGSKLTLATCDSFGSKSDRFVVVATLVESRSI